MQFSRLFYELPPLEKGEDHTAYFRRMQAAIPGAPTMELMECTRTKCQQAFARELLTRIVEGEDISALRQSVALLLKETYKL